MKVEPPGGDAFRGVLQANSPDAQLLPGFELDNRGKRSVAVDLERSGGPDLVRRLAVGADIFITNLTRHRVERYGLGFEEVRAINPRVVYVAFSGYGSSGPDADRGGFDYLAFWARSGIMGALGESGDAPVWARGGQGDHNDLAQHPRRHARRLRLRDQTPARRNASMVTLQLTGMWTIGTDVQNGAAVGRAAGGRSTGARPDALANSYPTATAAGSTDDAAGRTLTGRASARRSRARLATDERYDSIAKLLAHGAELAEALEQPSWARPRTWRAASTRPAVSGARSRLSPR